MDERPVETGDTFAPTRFPGARRPAGRTLAAIAIGFAGVLVAETAASRAPVALPVLFATGLLGAMVRPGWGGPGATWIGGALAEGGTAIVYLMTRPAVDTQWDFFVPVFVAVGMALFAGIFFAAAATAAGLRRLLPPRTAETVLRLAVATILGASLIASVAAPSSPLPGSASPEPPASPEPSASPASPASPAPTASPGASG